MTMNPEIKARWVAALRSGDYRQGTNRLCTRNPAGDHFCCLGVLADLAVKDGACQWQDQVQHDPGRDLPTEVKPTDGILPSTLLTWSGLDNACPEVQLSPASTASGYWSSNSLTALNDAANYPFSRIADFIEADPDL
jgi:hypothetical protein